VGDRGDFQIPCTTKKLSVRRKMARLSGAAELFKFVEKTTLGLIGRKRRERPKFPIENI
jgi:hypothetical protein